MRQEKILAAKQAAEHFIKWADVLLATEPSSYEICGNKFSGALRRSSLELTRFLAEMRRAG